MQEKSSKRAERRHEAKRLRVKRSTYYGYSRYTPEHPGRVFGIVVNTATLCSCPMCGNPRNYNGNGAAALTIQELSDAEVSRKADWW